MIFWSVGLARGFDNPFFYHTSCRGFTFCFVFLSFYGFIFFPPLLVTRLPLLRLWRDPSSPTRTEPPFDGRPVQFSANRQFSRRPRDRCWFFSTCHFFEFLLVRRTPSYGSLRKFFLRNLGVYICPRALSLLFPPKDARRRSSDRHN